jgi:hypothetical protein
VERAGGAEPLDALLRPMSGHHVPERYAHGDLLV